jgi:hypothetical protein
MTNTGLPSNAFLSKTYFNSLKEILGLKGALDKGEFERVGESIQYRTNDGQKAMTLKEAMSHLENIEIIGTRDYARSIQGIDQSITEANKTMEYVDQKAREMVEKSLADSKKIMEYAGIKDIE